MASEELPQYAPAWTVFWEQLTDYLQSLVAVACGTLYDLPAPRTRITGLWSLPHWLHAAHVQPFELFR